MEQLGKYRLKQHLARGGMADIYLAEQKGPGGFAKELVIKRILSQFAEDDEFIRMFLDEARLAAQLSHPKIAQIYELGEIEGSYFIAMEYIEGIDLARVIQITRQRGEPVPVDIAAKILNDVLEALDYAHDYTDREGRSLGLVHRDVSPHNVLVSNDGIVKLVDFGVAKAAANQAKTQTGAVKGKFAYMAPEQIQRKDLDRRTDIFAAGIIFYELLTGHKPFGEDLEAVSNILNESPLPPDVHRSDIPDAINQVMSKALAKDRSDRYSDAHEMVRDIEAYVRSEGDYVGDRELSTYMRRIQGLPTPRVSQAASSIAEATGEGGDVSPEVAGEEIVDEEIADEEFDQALPYQPTMASNAVEGAEESQKTSVPTAELHGGPGLAERSREQATDTESVVAQTSRGIPTGLIVLFGVIAIGILVAGGVALYLVMSADDGETPADAPAAPAVAVENKGETPPANEDAQPQKSALSHENGLMVYLSSTPAAEIWVDGTLAGETPFQTRLRPGKYRVELRSSKGKKEETFEVEPAKPVQRFKFKL